MENINIYNNVTNGKYESFFCEMSYVQAIYSTSYTCICAAHKEYNEKDLFAVVEQLKQLYYQSPGEILRKMQVSQH